MGTGTLLLLSVLVQIGSCCIYFKGLDFSDQRLVVRREREVYCTINKTTPHGSTVPCEGNATATRINNTHVLLRTYDDPDATFNLECGRDNETGKFAESYRADCPDPSPVPGKVKNQDENFRLHHLILVSVGSVIIIVLIFICKTYNKNRKAQNCNGNCASSSNDSSRADLTDGEYLNKKGQV